MISALCFLGSLACYSAFAAEMMQKSSGDEEQPAAADPVPADPEPVAPEPVTPDPGYVDPVEPEPEPTEPEPADPGYTESTVYEPDPVESGGETQDPETGSYTEQGSDSPFASYPEYTSDVNSLTTDTTTSTYVDNTEQYNQYIANTNQAQYDDNYIYVPEYEEPAQPLINTTSKIIDTDELTNDDWQSIMLSLSNGDLTENDGTQTFAFIKDNEEEGDTNMMWMVYLGTALIIASILMIIYVVVSTTKANSKEHEYYYA